MAVSTSRRHGINSATAIKAPVIAASTGNLTLSGEQTVDGIALVGSYNSKLNTGDRVLCKNQTTATENGIYQVQTSTWKREPDWDGGKDIVEGTQIPVSRGTVNGNTMWRVTNTGTFTVGTTSATFEAATVTVASGVAYTPAGTGAVATTVQAKLRESVSVKDFGAVGDGVTDDVAAIELAFTASSLVEFPAGTYLCNTDLDITTDHKIIGNNATIQMATGKQVHITGTMDAGATLGGDITAGDKTVTIATSFSANDIIFIEEDDSTTPVATITFSVITAGNATTITSVGNAFVSGDVGKNILVDTSSSSVYITAYSSATSVSGFVSNNNAPSTTSYTSGNWSLRTPFAQSRPYYNRGELGRVRSYAGGAATLETDCIEGYTGASTKGYKITPILSEIQDLNITGNFASNGVLLIENARDVTLSNVSTVNTGSTGSGFFIQNAYDVFINNCYGNAHYACLAHGVQNCFINGGNYYTDTGHAIEVSSGNGVPPARRVFINDANATGTDLFAINSHAGSSEVFLNGCEALGGVSLTGQNSGITGGKVWMGNTGREAVRLRPELGGKFMYASGVAINGGLVGIDYRENFAEAGMKSIIIDSCTIDGISGFTFFVDTRYNTLPFQVRKVIVNNTDVRASARALFVDCGAKNTGSLIDVIKITGGSYVSSASGSIRVDGDACVSMVEMSDVHAECAVDQAAFFLDDAIRTSILGNTLVGGGAGGSKNDLFGTNNVQNTIMGNNFINWKLNRGLLVAVTTSPENDLIVNNNYATVAGTIGSASFTSILRFNQDQNRWQSNTGAPGSGTWVRGDVVWDSTPTAGSFMGWVCTTAGTPGTWKTFGAISV